MKTILKMNPDERMTVEEALKHPYLEGLSEEFDDNDDEENARKAAGANG
jgi:hypothetical protein